jgi:hypothetical protein
VGLQGPSTPVLQNLGDQLMNRLNRKPEIV